MIETVKHEHFGIETHHRPLVSWGAIFAGLLLGNAALLLLMNLGSAIGLSAINVSDPEAVAKGLAVGTVIWVLVSSTFAFFLSGVTAAWMAGNVDRAVGAMHGVCVWALAAALAVFLGVIGTIGIAKTGQTVGQGLYAVGQSTPDIGPTYDEVSTEISVALREEIRQSVAAGAPPGTVSLQQLRQAVGHINPGTLPLVAGYVLRGESDQARNVLALNTNMSRERIDSVMSGLSRRAEQARARLKEAAGRAANYSAGAMWLIFFSGLFGLIASILGGSSGAHRLIRSYHRFERFETI